MRYDRLSLADGLVSILVCSVHMLCSIGIGL